MVENRVKKIWADGGAAVNGWLQVPSAVTAEFMSHQGWDSITIDTQHGLVDYQAAVGMLQAMEAGGPVPILRVPWNEPGAIMKALDAGAMGIICPMINTKAECEAFTGACRYAPVGYRSVGPIRAALVSGAGYHAAANDAVLTLAMIETTTALENLDEIMSVPELDGIYIGPSDLSVSMGFAPGFDPTEPAVVEAIHKILGAAQRHGKLPGIHCGSVGFALQMAEAGFAFVTILSELRLMTWAANNAVTAFKAGATAPNAP